MGISNIQTKSVSYIGSSKKQSVVISQLKKSQNWGISMELAQKSSELRSKSVFQRNNG